MSENTEAALTATFKAGKDFDAPWLVVRADHPGQLVQMIEGIQQGGLAAVLAAAAKDFHGVYQMGHQLGATPVPQPAVQVQQQAPQAPAAPQAAPQQQGGFPQAPQWGGQQQAAQPQQPAYQQPVAPAAPAAQAAVPAEGPFIPGLGMSAKVKTGIAKTGRNVGSQWVRYEDPRNWGQIKDLEKTKDINDPGIAAGTHRYEAYAN